MDDLEPTHPAALRKRVHFSDNDKLTWPVLFMYPEHGETDFIEEFREDQTLRDHLEVMFQDQAPWDQEHKYRVDSLTVCFEDQDSKLRQVDVGLTLLEAMKLDGFRVIGGTPGFIITVRGSQFHKDFVKKYE